VSPTRPASLAETLPPRGLLKRLETRIGGAAPAEIRRRGQRVTVSEAPWGSHAPTPAQARILRLVRAMPVFRATLRIQAALRLDSLRPGPIDDRLFGARTRFYPMLAASFRHMLLTPDACEREERAFLAAHTAATGAFVDIGANCGIYSLWAAGRRPGEPVIAFEPLEPFATILALNAGFAGFRGVAVIRAAAGGADGTIAFSPSQQSAGYGADSVPMPCRSLLSVLAEHGVGSVAALKIDAEAVEDQILFPFFEAAPPALRPRAVLIEHVCRHLWQRDCLGLLAGLGYRETFRNKLNAGYVLP
jgi:FkbM family methyltransferase